MNMYLHELKANRKFALSWFIAIIAVVFFLVSFYPIFSKEMSDFLQIINNLPEMIRNALGMHSETIGSILGYYSFILTFIIIFGAIQAMIMGLSILSKEMRQRTADFLLSKPVSRFKIVTSKLLACLTILVISNILYFVIFYFILLSFSNATFAFNTYVLLTLVLLLMQLLFFSLGVVLSVFMLKIKAILPISLGTVFGFYLLSTFTEDKLRVLMPFQYFKATDILLKTSYELRYLFLSLGIIAVFICVTYIVYKNKDIDAV